MQLVAYGAQDVYLTANPQVTFFKQIYRRHSNFAMEAIEQKFNGVASFGKKVTATISRNGDLISRVYLQATLPKINSADGSGGLTINWIYLIGQYLIKSVEIEIGGQVIDKHYGDWLHIWNELTLPPGKARAYLRSVNGLGGVELSLGDGTCSDCVPSAGGNGCDLDFISDLAAKGTDSLVCGSITPTASYRDCLRENTLMIPLEFWFCRHYGLALPLIALQYHEVKINLEFNELKYLVNIPFSNPGQRAQILNTINSRGLASASLWVDYIYLDTEERRRFAQVAHEYLIEQLQFTGEESLTTTNNKIALDLNHPVKEIVWVAQDPTFIDCNSHFNEPYNYTTNNKNNSTAIARIQLNGHDRFADRHGDYFNFIQPYQHHTNTPSTGINVYSFAIRPEEHQPSGTCNFSRIDNAVLNLTLSPDAFENSSSLILRVYATNYNVLRIMAGMGGLSYSN